ncbi:MAG: ComEC/Rec2 family competence protein [Bacteroidales bacterium]|nr:ComEC/Rec2 family competence protein [Bacteroidales bacterium]
MIREFLPFRVSYLPILILSVIVIIISYYPFSIKNRFRLKNLFGIGVFIFVVSFGVFITERSIDNLNYSLDSICDNEQIVMIKIINYPVIKNNTLRFKGELYRAWIIKVANDSTLKTIGEKDDFVKSLNNKKIILNVYVPLNNQDKHTKYSYNGDKNEFNNSKNGLDNIFDDDLHLNDFNKSLEAGDILICSSSIYKIKNLGNPFEFDYAKSMRNKGVKYSLYVKSYFRAGQNQSGFIKKYTNRIRKEIIETINKIPLNEKQRALASTLIIGDREKLDQETIVTIRENGLSHILAISGLHTGIIFIILGFLLYPLKMIAEERLYYILLIMGIFIYALITGMSISVCRAALMISTVLIGHIIYKKGDTFNIICFCAFMLLAFNPYNLFDIGFQLSFSAVLSILLFYPLIRMILISENPILDKLLNIVSVTLAAQIFTLPISIYYFNQFPIFSIPANLIILPLLPFYVITISITALLLSLNIESDILLHISKFISDIIIDGSDVGHLIGISVSNPMIYLTSYRLLSILIMLLLTAIFFYEKRTLKPLIAIIVILILIVFPYKNQAIDETIIFNDNSNVSIHNFSGMTHYAFIDNNTTAIYSEEKGNNAEDYNTFNNKTLSYSHVFRDNNNIHLKNKKLINLNHDSARVITHNKLEMLYKPLSFKNYVLKRGCKEIIEIVNDTVFASKIKKQPFIHDGKNSFFILDNNNLLSFGGINMVVVDYLILSNNYSLGIGDFKSKITYKHLVIHPSLKKWVKDKLRNELKEKNIDYYDIENTGALRIVN